MKIILRACEFDGYRMMAGSSKSYWRLSKYFATQSGMSNKWLEEQGLVNIKALWCKAQGYK